MSNTTTSANANTTENEKLFENYSYPKKIAAETNITEKQIAVTIELLTAGNTIPFISRYRKEQTGNLDEVQIKEISDKYEYYYKLNGRKEDIVKSITEQGKMTDELFKKIIGCDKMQILEDLYLPYKPKKRTRGTIARELGLEPLALLIKEEKIENGNATEYAEKYIDASKGISKAADAFDFAMDIVAEDISDNADFRNIIREFYKKSGILTSAKKEKKAAKKSAEKDESAQEKESENIFNKNSKTNPQVYEIYFDYNEPVFKIPPHRILAINRGESEGFLTVKIDMDEKVSELLKEAAEKFFIKNKKCIFTQYYEEALKDSLKRLVIPSITNEIRSELTQTAENHAIKIFSENLDALLMQPPIYNKVVMALDPGYRAGTKIAVVDQNGKVLAYTAIYPHPPQNETEKSKKVLIDLINANKVDLIAIGNGTASRETETFIAGLIAEKSLKVKFAIVSEAGASVYSASKIAAKEFPELDVLVRSAISIARRVQDPLSELVKIDPKSIGVGEYQHDVNQKELENSLGYVVTSCVNRVGVNINTASATLLKYISGLNESQAESIVKFREEKGRFISRAALKKVPKIGAKTFEQAVGFLKVPESENPLDFTWIHPESYGIAEKLINTVTGEKLSEFHGKSGIEKLRESFARVNESEFGGLAEKLGCSRLAVSDIVNALQKPGLDLRDELPPIMLKSNVLSIGDIKIGDKLMGTVRNVVDFGVFVDIGIKNDALCHISHCSDKFIKHPLEVLKIGNILEFTVIGIDIDKGRVSLSLKSNPFEERAQQKPSAGQSQPAQHRQNHPNSNVKPANNVKPADKVEKVKDDYNRQMRDNFISTQIIFKKLKK
ncbi:MAG: Tex family protein [Candidatus Wallbacteria bacterium]